MASGSRIHLLLLHLLVTSILQMPVIQAARSSSSSSPSSTSAAKCPQDLSLIYPCKCHHDESIVCTEPLTYNISHIFLKLSHHLMMGATSSSSAGGGQIGRRRPSSRTSKQSSSSAEVRPLYKEFVLSNPYTTLLADNMFHLVRFKRITLMDMVSLGHVESGAFNGTNRDVQYFAIKGEFWRGWIRGKPVVILCFSIAQARTS